jgi:hypothetical protein
MFDQLINCKICNKQFANFAISRHLKFIHNLSLQQYYDKHLRKSKNEGKCLICKKETDFQNLTKKYRKFCSIFCRNIFASNLASISPNRGGKNRGYTIRVGKLAPNWKKKVKKKCLTCKKIMLLMPSRNWRQYCNQECAHKSKKYKKAQSKGHKGKPTWNKGLTKETDERIKRCAEIRTNQKRTKEQRNTMSKSRANLYLKLGANYFLKHSKRGIFYSTKNKANIRYESGLELLIYKLLEQMSHVKSYQRCNFFIEYQFDTSIHRYIPDLFVEYSCDQNEIIEIKPNWQLKDMRNKAKFKAAKRYAKKINAKFVIYTEDKEKINV